uniref:Spindle and kinetochore-associated protein 3 n=1 Tax=Ascaris lumbricoides TaxID=6252 RepID=A0A0M3I1D8_ASCLU
MEDLDMVLHLLKDTSYTVGLEGLSQDRSHSTNPEVTQQVNTNSSLKPKEELNSQNISKLIHNFKLTEEEMKECYSAVYGC